MYREPKRSKNLLVQPLDKWENKDKIRSLLLEIPDKEELHPLRKQYLENRLKEIDY